ncbi:hypothetical protein HN799_05585 [Candidatus Woesearchaeota archaeon]|jgi:hypothetical protein|nr:hypothetical protein [Candidatus Woesearchaeota archaeon]MBT7332716.1 hypothetical protein [Candidatus Woesearchaeota archaeon]
MISKKGQLTIFIIVGILIVTAIATVFFVVQKGTEDKVGEVDSETGKIKAYFENCLKSTTEKGIAWNGQQGGYYLTPDPSAFYFSNVILVPYYFYHGLARIPDDFVFEEQLNKYILDNFEENCDLDFFSEEGYEIEIIGELKINSKLLFNSFFVEMEYPLRIKQGEETTELDKFSIEVASKFKDIILAVKMLMEDRVDKEGICLSCMEDYSEEYGLEFESFYNTLNGDSFLVVYDEQDKDKEKGYKFIIAMEEGDFNFFGIE